MRVPYLRYIALVRTTQTLYSEVQHMINNAEREYTCRHISNQLAAGQVVQAFPRPRPVSTESAGTLITLL